MTDVKVFSLTDWTWVTHECFASRQFLVNSGMGPSTSSISTLEFSQVQVQVLQLKSKVYLSPVKYCQMYT